MRFRTERGADWRGEMEELRNKMTVAAHCILSIPKLLPMIGLRQDQGSIEYLALLPKDHESPERGPEADCLKTKSYIKSCSYVTEDGKEKGTTAT